MSNPETDVSTLHTPPNILLLLHIDLLTWSHDTNLVINVLLDALLKRDVLPPVLYSQFDNTAREINTLCLFLAYLAFSVRYKSSL